VRPTPEARPSAREDIPSGVESYRSAQVEGGPGRLAGELQGSRASRRPPGDGADRSRPGWVDFRVPGSKSLTQRALVAAALAPGRSTLTGALRAEDTSRLLQVLKALGVNIRASRTRMVVEGVGGRFLPSPDTLDLGDNGTAARLLVSLATLGQGQYTLDGSPRLRQRPLAPLVEALRALGAHLDYLEEPGHLPLRVTAGGLQGGQVVFGDLDSSQYVSSLLMLGPHLREPLTLLLSGRTVSEPYIAMTAAVMARFGARVQRQAADRWRVHPGGYQAGNFAVEADASSASYGAAAAVLTSTTVCIPGLPVDSLQGDAGFFELVASLGARIERGPQGVQVSGQPMQAGERTFDMGTMPDMVPTLALLAAFREGRTRIRGVSHLRLKESDRLAALVSELRRLGCQATENPDGLAIEGRGGRGLHAARIRTYRDHRIAMALGLARLVLPGVRIQDPGCVAKSFPGFWHQLRKFTVPGGRRGPADRSAG